MKPQINSQIARLELVPLREVWKHEAHDFTVWLADNLDVLTNVIGKELSLVSRESSVGPFSADILAEDEDGNQVVIENQLEKTDHDHLGKLITYVSNLDAKVAIWITSYPRPEHENAIQWLNEVAPADVSFYLLQVRAYRINDSLPAPHLSLIAGADPVVKQAGEAKKGTVERHVLRRRFWEQLLERMSLQSNLFTNISATIYHWISVNAGLRGLSYIFAVTQSNGRVELFIDRGDEEFNRRLLEKLQENQPEIESAFGDALTWSVVEGRRSSKITYTVTSGGWRTSEDAWENTHDQMINAMIRLHTVTNQYIPSLRSMTEND